CGFPIALAPYDAKNEILERLPKRIAAFCAACGQDRDCSTSRIENKLLAAAAPDFQSNPAFVLEWHKQDCPKCIEMAEGQWNLCETGQELLRQVPLTLT